MIALAAPANTWLPVGPNGGDARSLTFDPKNPDRIFAGTSTGTIFVSNDFGKTWQRFARIGLGDDYVLDHISIDPANGTMYVAAWSLTEVNGGLFRSQDGGKTWNSIKAMQGKSIRAMALAPSDPKIITVGALDGVFRSHDGGESWQHISPENYAELKNIESLAIDPANPDVIYAGTWHLPWKTDDGGKTWHNIKNGVIDDSDVFSIIVDPKAPSVVYASACSGIYKSDNAGDLFSKVQGIPYSARRTRVLKQDPIRRDVVYAGTTEGLWRTEDAGKSWKLMTPKNVIINDVLVDPRDYNHVLMATDRGGILYSANAGESFTPSNDGYSHRQVAAVEVSHADPNTVYAGVLNDKEYGGVFVSRDLGASWQQISNGLDGRDVFSLREIAPGELLAGTNQGIFLRSGDGAWRPMNDIVRETTEIIPGKRLNSKTKAKTKKAAKRLPDKTVVKQIKSTLTARVNDIEADNGKWMAATADGLYISADRGKSWQPIASDGVGDIVSVAAAQNHAGADADWIIAGRTSVRLSNDAGKTWTEPRLPNITNIVSVAIAPDQSLWVAGLQGAFRSSDHGKTWTYVWNLPAKQIAHLDWDDTMGGIVATGVESTDLYFSKDGTKWTTMPAGWLLRRVASSRGRAVAATAFDGIVVQPQGTVSVASAKP
ncbi:MAG: transcriptional regulator [Acidobacteriaceae bacterium]